LLHIFYIWISEENDLRFTVYQLQLIASALSAKLEPSKDEVILPESLGKSYEIPPLIGLL
jgi:hypothetical protein